MHRMQFKQCITRRLQRRSLRLPTKSKWAQTGHLCTTAQAGAVQEFSHVGQNFGYIVMLRARIFRSLIIRTGIKERNIRARNITI